jgi:iron(II)-dependent oxidoreductase
MPPKFFITHSWKDIEFARRLFNDLTTHGLEGWLDDVTLQGGHRLVEQINKGLEWRDVYIPILSRAALASSWCWEEINAAIALFNKKNRQGRPRIISVLIEDCEEELPAVLAARLYINFTNRYDDALKELLTKGFGVRLAKQPQIAAPPPPKVVTPPRTIINPKDGKEMILIPASEFVMGSDEGEEREKPPHKVYIDPFYISRYPVTNGEYKKFVDATKYSPPSPWQNGKIPPGKENHPVVNVSWNDAVVYAQWAGARLPTEAEWEKAASWDDIKKEKRVYPWGKDFDASKCNTSESGIGDTTPVGKYSPRGDSFYGVADMAGNVWEWCADWYDANYYKNSPRENPKGPASGQYRVLRGGSWVSDRYLVRAACRDMYDPDRRSRDYGFRVVVSHSDSVALNPLDSGTLNWEGGLGETTFPPAVQK